MRAMVTALGFDVAASVRISSLTSMNKLGALALCALMAYAGPFDKKKKKPPKKIRTELMIYFR